MSRTVDPTNFFQSAAALDDIDRKARKSKNKWGDPIVLPSKILAVVVAVAVAPGSENERGGGEGEGEACVYVAESAGTARRVALDTRNISHVYRGPQAPLTSLAISPDGRTLFAGCWDKSVWSWDVKVRKPGRRFLGHADFVKSVVCARIGNSIDILISGSADASIIVWNVVTGRKIHVLTGHTRGILDLAVDPVSLVSSQPQTTPPRDITLFSAGSDPEIRRWRISETHAGETTALPEQGTSPTSNITTTQSKPKPLSPILNHETSVNKLFFPPLNPSSDLDEEDVSNLYTASSDTTAKILLRSTNFHTEDLSLPHPDFVRSVTVSPSSKFIVTVCRDEHVRVWDAGTGKLETVFEGHYEEVTGVVVLVREGREVVVSVGIDGTVRQWGLGKGELEKWKEGEVERRRAEAEGFEEVEVKKVDEGKGLLTEEEERELAELMEMDEDD